MSSLETLLPGKMIHLALPVRWAPAGQEGRGASEVACTYDIRTNGARLVSARAVNVGDLVVVERGRNKALCQVVWAGDPSSALRGQFAVQCIEGKMPWEEELRQMEEQFEPLIIDAGAPVRSFSRTEANRRRRPRFYVEGQAEVIDGVQHLAGEVQQISELGARILAKEMLRPGTDFRLLLSIFDVSLALKAQVRSVVNQLGMGVEFQQIRRGDRPLLNYVLGKVKTKKVEEFIPGASQVLAAVAI
jgi:hypothetical protein